MASPALAPSQAEVIESWLLLFWAPGQVAELRALGAPRSGTVSGYFDDPGKLAKAATYWSGKAEGVYWTPNPVDPALLARAANRTEIHVRRTTDDKQIIRRRWFLVDFDPRRPAGISASHQEKAMTRQRCLDCRSWLATKDWPGGILADSGNGYHLLYRIDLPNDEKSRVLLQRSLQALALRFEDDQVSIDVTNFNAARIWKIYGTLACKGDHTPDRPHRLSAVLEVS